MILITSGAYVDPEFRIEFGSLPPAFLPVGNQRLFERQIQKLSAKFPTEKVFISIPKSYLLNQKDLNYFNNHNVSIVRVDENISLSESIAAVIDELGLKFSSIRILHGDTLLEPIPHNYDVIAVADTREDYLWEVEKIQSTSELVWCGYFSFSDINILRSCLRQNGVSFVQAVKKYEQSNKVERVLVDSWSDFGHINTYFHSRTKITTERSFNSLFVEHGCVHKTGENISKIKGELQWFINAPREIKVFCPQLIDFGVNDFGSPYYAIEYLHVPPLNEIYVHGTNPVFYWHKIFKLCADFLQICQSFPVGEGELEEIRLSSRYLAEEKTIFRLDDFFSKNKKLNWDTKLSINGLTVPTARKIVDECMTHITRMPIIPGISHGDFCLSNILFDSRSDRIKVIDPRGLNGFDRESNLGDLTYDVAKLNHSVIGLYDFIISGAYRLSADFNGHEFNAHLDIFIDERIRDVQKVFSDKKFFGQVSSNDVMPLTILLFLSMLPMHCDNPDRQLALFANALRLYKIFTLQSQEVI